MKWIRWIDTAVAVAIVALVVIARDPSAVFATGTCGGSTACGSGFNGSYHDFVTGPLANSTVNLNGTNTTVGQCTMCHTPHQALMTTLLWNHHLSNNTQFTWDVNSTMAGTPYAIIANNWAGPTTKCLSCHDGSVARSTINWYQGQTPLPGTPRGTVTCTTTGGITSCVTNQSGEIGNGGNMGPFNGAGATHPVAMPYPCGGVASTYDGVGNGGQIVFSEWVSKPALPIRLYQQTGLNAVTRAAPGNCTPGSAGIECSSCHDVHNRENLDTDLLRGYISGSGANYLCNECHAK